MIERRINKLKQKPLERERERERERGREGGRGKEDEFYNIYNRAVHRARKRSRCDRCCPCSARDRCLERQRSSRMLATRYSRVHKRSSDEDTVPFEFQSRRSSRLSERLREMYADIIFDRAYYRDARILSTSAARSNFRWAYLAHQAGTSV